MGSELVSLFTPGYDSTMQGLIGDENADQARGQQAMAQMQNQGIAQQELQQREGASLRDYELANRGLAANQEENEKKRLHDLNLESISAENVSKSNVQQNDFQVAQIELNKRYLDARYRKQQKNQLELALISQKAEEARLNGDFETAKLHDAEELALRDKSSKDAMAIGVAQNLQGKSRDGVMKFLNLMLQRMGETQRTYEASQGQLQGAIAQNTGRVASDRRDHAIGAARSFKLAHSAYMNSGTGAARLVTPNLDGIERLDGIQFLRYNPEQSVGANIYAMNPYGDKSKSAYGFSEMDAKEMDTAISDHITTSTLDLIEQMGMKSVDKTAGAEAIKAAMQGRPEAEVIALLQKAKIDPVIFKGVTDQLARTTESEGVGGDIKRARETLRAAEAASGGEETVELIAARVNFKAIQTYGTNYRKIARSVVNVTDVPALKSMIAAIAEVTKSGQYEGLVDARIPEMARLMPDDPDVLKELAASRAGEVQSLADIARLGTSQVETQKRLTELESRKGRSKVQGDKSAASVARAELERLLRESDE